MPTRPDSSREVPNVVFVEGMVRQDNRWLFYYGGADKYVGVAEAAYGSAASTPPHPVVDDRLLLDHLLRINGLMPKSARPSSSSTAD